MNCEYEEKVQKENSKLQKLVKELSDMIFDSFTMIAYEDYISKN